MSLGQRRALPKKSKSSADVGQANGLDLTMLWPRGTFWAKPCGPTPGTLFFINPRREKEKQVVLNFH